MVPPRSTFRVLVPDIQARAVRPCDSTPVAVLEIPVMNGMHLSISVGVVARVAVLVLLPAVIVTVFLERTINSLGPPGAPMYSQDSQSAR